MPSPGATEAAVPQAPRIEVGHLLVDAGHTKGINAQIKREAMDMQIALNKASSAEMAKRALEKTTRKGEHFYDGRDIDKSLDQIKDKATQDKAKIQVNKARTQMAAIDVLRFQTPADQATRLAELVAEGRVPTGITTVDDLKKQAVGQIVGEKWFLEFVSESKFKPADLPAVAEALFLKGPTADLLQATLGEQVGLLQENIQKLPGVAKTSTENAAQSKVDTEAIMGGVEVAIQTASKDMAGLAATATLTPDQQQGIKAALQKGNESERKQALTKTIAEIQGVTPAGFTAIEQLATDKKTLADLKTKLITAPDKQPTKGPKVQTKTQITADIALREAAIVAAETTYKTEIQKYDQAKAFAEGKGNDLAKIYQENQTKHTLAELAVLGASSTPTSADIPKDVQDRALAEQQLLKKVDGLTATALNEAVQERTNVLSEGAVKAAENLSEEAQKKKDDALVDLLTTYKGSLRKGDKSYFETSKGPSSKDRETETMHIRNLSGAMSVIADYDTQMGTDGTDFMIAYHAGLIAKAPIIDKTGNMPSVDVLGELAALKKDPDKALKLAAICTPEMRVAYRSHLFAETARAQRYIDAGGVLKADWVRKLKGINVKIDGDTNDMKTVVNKMDKIFIMHEAEIQGAIDKSHDAQNFINQLKGEGWIAGDKKTKNILWALLIGLGMITVPIGGALIPAIAGTGMVGAEIAGGAIAGGIGAKKIIENNSN